MKIMKSNRRMEKEKHTTVRGRILKKGKRREKKGLKSNGKRIGGLLTIIV